MGLHDLQRPARMSDCPVQVGVKQNISPRRGTRPGAKKLRGRNDGPIVRADA